MLELGVIGTSQKENEKRIWESASRSISAALIVHLPTILAGRESWYKDETLRRAVVIDAGVIQKPEILSFQGRRAPYPHEVLGTR